MIKITHIEKNTEEKVAKIVFNFLNVMQELFPFYFQVHLNDGNRNTKSWKKKPNE